MGGAAVLVVAVVVIIIMVIVYFMFMSGSAASTSPAPVSSGTAAVTAAVTPTPAGTEQTSVEIKKQRCPEAEQTAAIKTELGKYKNAGPNKAVFLTKGCSGILYGSGLATPEAAVNWVQEQVNKQGNPSEWYLHSLNNNVVLY
jgi:subtilisin family serine protease